MVLLYIGQDICEQYGPAWVMMQSH